MKLILGFLLVAAVAAAQAFPVHNKSREGGDKVLASYPKVNVTLYMESLCPDCEALITSDIWSTWNAAGLQDIMNLTLVPYGNAKETQNGNTWEFTCQHGVNECVGNLLETCAIHHLGNSSVWFPFIYCLESDVNPYAAGPKCAQQLGIDFDPIDVCMTGAEGNALEHQMALLTDALVPSHTYVPWVTLNGAHCTACENGSFKKAICQAYTGPKPAGC